MFTFLNSSFKYESTSRDWLFPVPVLDRGTRMYRVYWDPSSSDKSFSASIFADFLPRGSIHGDITPGSSSQCNQRSLTLGPIYNEIELWGRIHDKTRTSISRARTDREVKEWHCSSHTHNSEMVGLRLWNGSGLKHWLKCSEIHWGVSDQLKEMTCKKLKICDPCN